MAARPPVAAGGPPPEQKKGEVNELRVLLRTVNTDKDSKRKRDVIKKVIGASYLCTQKSMVARCQKADWLVIVSHTYPIPSHVAVLDDPVRCYVPLYAAYMTVGENQKAVGRVS